MREKRRTKIEENGRSEFNRCDEIIKQFQQQLKTIFRAHKGYARTKRCLNYFEILSHCSAVRRSNRALSTQHRTIMNPKILVKFSNFIRSAFARIFIRFSRFCYTLRVRCSRYFFLFYQLLTLFLPFAHHFYCSVLVFKESV